MDEFKFIQINGELDTKDKNKMVEEMLAYHASKGHPRKTDIFP